MIQPGSALTPHPHKSRLSRPSKNGIGFWKAICQRCVFVGTKTALEWFCCRSWWDSPTQRAGMRSGLLAANSGFMVGIGLFHGGFGGVCGGFGGVCGGVLWDKSTGVCRREATGSLTMCVRVPTTTGVFGMSPESVEGRPVRFRERDSFPP